MIIKLVNNILLKYYYGDRYPVTTEGRLIGIIVMIVGVGLFGTLSGYIASLFVGEKRTNSEKENE